MSALLELILSILDFILYYFFFSSFMGKRPWVKGKWLIFSLIIVAVLEYSISIFHLQIASILVNAGIVCIMGIIIFSGSLLSKFLLIILGIFFSFILENLAGFFTSWIFGIEASKLIDYPYISIFALFLCLCLKLCIIYIADKRKNSIHLLEHHTVSIKTVSIPLLSFFGGIWYGYFSLIKADPDYGLIVGVFIFLISINIIYYFVLESHAKLYQQNYEHLMNEKEYALKEEYYQNVERYQKEVRTIKHDLKNQLLTIGAYITKPEDKRAEAQLKKIMDELLDDRQITFTAHSGLNMLLNAKWKQAQNYQVTCDFVIKVPETLKFDEKDLGSLIGNILDNALEASKKCITSRFIQLRMIYYKNSLVIQAENSTDGLVKNLQTRKQDTVSHGLGTQSIRTIVEKYHGNMEYSIKEKSFVIDITLWESNI